MSLRLIAVYGSVRSDRQGIRAARFIVNECRARGHEVTLIDPLEYRLPLLDKMYKEHPTGALRANRRGIVRLRTGETALCQMY